jgi:hypothetical protein
MLKKILLSLLILGGGAMTARAADCDFPFTLNGNNLFLQVNNKARACYNWQLTYYASGYSGLTITFQSAADGGQIPGAFSSFAGTTLSGSNPMTSTDTGTATFTGSYAWLRVVLSGTTGTGTVTGRLLGNQLTTASAFTSLFPVVGGQTACGIYLVTSCTAPARAGFAWRNQRSATITTASGQETMNVPSPNGSGDAAPTVYMRGKAYPSSTPWSVTMAFTTNMTNSTANTSVGFFFYDIANNKAEVFGLFNGGQPIIQAWTTATGTATAANISTWGGFWMPGVGQALTVFKLLDDGTNIKMYTSIDGGANFLLLYTVARHGSLTNLDEFGYYAVDNNGNYPVQMNVISWTQGTT